MWGGGALGAGDPLVNLVAWQAENRGAGTEGERGGGKGPPAPDSRAWPGPALLFGPCDNREWAVLSGEGLGPPGTTQL